MEANRERVLVVDDDGDLLELVAGFLSDAGYRVSTASHGQAALDRVEDEMPDLILLDMRMPVMDGWEFTRRYRARWETRAPIVVVTAADDAARRAREVGASGYLGKPFDVDDLLEIVERGVGRAP